MEGTPIPTAQQIKIKRLEDEYEIFEKNAKVEINDFLYQRFPGTMDLYRFEQLSINLLVVLEKEWDRAINKAREGK